MSTDVIEKTEGINEEIDNSPIENVPDILDLTTLSIVSCHVASGTSRPGSFDLFANIGGNISARLSDETGIIEEEIVELGTNDMFDPQANEVCEVESSTQSGKDYLRNHNQLPSSSNSAKRTPSGTFVAPTGDSVENADVNTNVFTAHTSMFDHLGIIANVRRKPVTITGAPGLK